MVIGQVLFWICMQSVVEVEAYIYVVSDSLCHGKYNILLVL